MNERTGPARRAPGKRLASSRHGTAVIVVVALLLAAARAGAVDFGDDASPNALDGECDDPRFEGPGMYQGQLQRSDDHHDATDCRTQYEARRVSLIETPNTHIVLEASRSDGLHYDENTGRGLRGQGGVASHFGDNTSDYAFDGECDDPRLTGPGMADVLDRANVGRDAYDCEALHEEGEVWWNNQ